MARYWGVVEVAVVVGEFEEEEDAEEGSEERSSLWSFKQRIVPVWPDMT